MGLNEIKSKKNRSLRRTCFNIYGTESLMVNIKRCFAYPQKARNAKTRTNQNLLMYGRIIILTHQQVNVLLLYYNVVLLVLRRRDRVYDTCRLVVIATKIEAGEDCLTTNRLYNSLLLPKSYPNNRTEPTNHVATVAPFCVVLCCGTVCFCSCCSILRCVRSPRARQQQQQQHGTTRLSPPFFRCLRHHRGDTRRHDIVPFVRERQGHERYCELFQR